MKTLKKGFTLIELLVVIAIIAILAAILFPVFASAKDAAKKAASISNLKQTVMGSILYMTDADDKLTVTQWPSWYINVAREQAYVKNRDMYKAANSPWKQGAMQRREADNGVDNYMFNPVDGCVGLQPSTAGLPYYQDVYPPLDYEANSSLFSWTQTNCTGRWWPSGNGGVQQGKTQNDGEITDIAKVVLWIQFPQAFFQWPGGTSGPSAAFWGANFRGYHAEGSVVGHFDGHAKYYKFQKLLPRGVEWSGANVEWKAWGFSWGDPSVQ
jgi:prepilin-type N-terminal cleavage/methylation domain-containing protein